MKTNMMLFLTMLITFAASYASAQNMDISKLSKSEKRLLIGSLYLSKCVTSPVSTGKKDFRVITKNFDNRYIRAMPKKTNGPDKYYDESALTTLSLSRNTCSVKIRNKGYGKFISTLPSILAVLDGKIKLRKTDKGYTGILKSMGAQYKVTTYSKQSVITAIIVRK